MKTERNFILGISIVAVLIMGTIIYRTITIPVDKNENSTVASIIGGADSSKSIILTEQDEGGNEYTDFWDEKV